MLGNVEKFFNAALRNIKNGREAYLYRCFDTEFRKYCEQEYGFIFWLSDYIVKLEEPSKKSEYSSKDCRFLKKLVSDLFVKNLDGAKEQIDESIGCFGKKNLSDSILKYVERLKKQVPTNSVYSLSSLSSRAKSHYVKENCSAMQRIYNKINEFVEAGNKSFAQKNSDDFQSLLEQRTDEEEKSITKTNKNINNPSILQRIKDWWRSPNLFLFGAGKKNKKYYGDLKVKRELKVEESKLKIEELNNLKGKSCLELGKQAQTNKVVFGNTEIGRKLSGLWDKFKLTYKKITNHLSKVNSVKEGKKERRKSMPLRNNQHNKKQPQPPRKNSWPRCEKQKNKSPDNKAGFFTPKKTDQKYIEILFDRPQQFHTTKVHEDYKKDKVYHVRTHISNKDYSILKREVLKSGGKMLHSLLYGYVKYENRMPGREFNKEKFDKICNLNSSPRPRMN